MEAKALAKKVVDTMFDKDWFSQWMNIERKTTMPGHCILQMPVKKEMLNGFGIIHGGITFSLADSALAFASNAHGIRAVSIEASMSYMLPAHEGDVLMYTPKFSLFACLFVNLFGDCEQLILNPSGIEPSD